MIIQAGVLIGTDPDDHSSGVLAICQRSSDPAHLLFETLKVGGR